MKYFYISLILSLNSFQALAKTNSKDDLSLEDGAKDHAIKGNKISKEPSVLRYFNYNSRQDEDNKSAKRKMNIVQNVRKHENNLNIGRDLPPSRLTETVDRRTGREFFHMDPVLNELKRRRSLNFRRQGSDYHDSSEMEMKFWMDEWDEHWMQKKFEALNATQPRGDVVNMVAARPWGVPCGDPNQHDMPWGSCMLPAECDAEYRVYRGDYFCGRTMYVCCALQVTNYDMYQGLDISFEGSSFSTDSNEKNAKAGSREEARKRREHEKNKRKKERDKRKRKIRKSIRKIVSEIRKILNRSYRNGTAQRKKKTRELKKFIEMMKDQFRKDRKSVVNVHEFEMVKIDEKLQAQLDKIRDVNEDFMTNDTFREIIVNGTINKTKLAALLRSHPRYSKLFKSRRSRIEKQARIHPLTEKPFPVTEESSSDIEAALLAKNIPLHHYDVELGVLYY
uniref:Uncharacterized protein n=1 Tax=Heliothis virescens TaxID=7102 RepID=A0A2A4JU39_HELVI